MTRAHNVRAVALVASLSLLLSVGSVVSTGSRQEAGAQGAAADYFLKIGSIEGEATHDRHRGEIEIASWSWGASNSTTVAGTGAGAGKASFQDLHVTFTANKATPKLMLLCAQGKVVPSATLTGEGPNGAFFTLEMSNVLVSGFSVEGDRVSGPPVNEMRLRFSRVVMTQIVQRSDGTTEVVKAGYDLALNKKV